MTTDDKTLTEQIARALVGAMECEGTMIEVPEGDDIWCTTHDHGIENGEWCRYVAHAAATVLPVIRKAERDAAREALDGLAVEARKGIVLHETTWGYGQSIAYAAETYRDTHYRIPEETP